VVAVDLGHAGVDQVLDGAMILAWLPGSEGQGVTDVLGTTSQPAHSLVSG
jgi:hypothetical protein